MTLEFRHFPKLARLARPCVVTEKIDGTNAQVCITEYGDIFAGSRNRWITPEHDNYGFARWVEGNKEDLLQLGVGHHFGEWWGQGIQRGYRLNEKRFSLFNAQRWAGGSTPAYAMGHLVDTTLLGQKQPPACCHVVPVVATGLFDELSFDFLCHGVLALEGSFASPGFMNPEGIVVYHTAGNVGFKMTLEKDDQPKGQPTT